MPKISIVIVTYKRLAYLTITVNAILKQTYQDWELIVVADGHEKEVEDYLISIKDNRIKYFYVDHCGYPAKGRNLGVKETTGEFIAFCDDDDIWKADKLEKQINVFENNSNIVLCCTNRNIINSNGEITELNIIKHTHNFISLKKLLKNNYITYSSVVLQKHILEKSGVFPDDIRFKAVEDYYLWVRIALFGQIYFLNESLVLYRIHENNISQKLSIGAKQIMFLLKDLFQKHPIKPTYKLQALSIAYFKIIAYKLLGK